MDFLDLNKTYSFYAQYHHHPVNKLIHIIFVPIIFSTSIQLLSRYVPSLLLWTISSLFAASYVYMDSQAGIAYLPFMGLMTYCGIAEFWKSYAIPLLMIGWIAQFVGHGVFEGKRPALVDNIIQAIHSAIFFVWLEVIFSLGFRKELQKRLSKKS